MDSRWKKNSGCVYNVGYHLIWCSKYRRKILVGDVEIRLVELLKQKAIENQWKIEQIETMPDHVHVFIKATPVDSIAHIISQLKGYTSFELRKEFPALKSRLPSLWTRSYYVETIGHISQDTIKIYIENQKNK